MKNKARLLAIFFVAATTFFASCSENTDTPSSLAGTSWVAQVTDEENSGMELTFFDGNSGMLRVSDHGNSNHPLDYAFSLSYTYSLSGSNGNGDIDLDEFGTYAFSTITFSVNGNKLTLSIPGNSDIVFTRQTSPTPIATTGLEGTSWQTTFSRPYLDDDDTEHEGYIDLTIEFKNSYSGTLRAVFTVPDIPSAGYDDKAAINYTYSAPNGTISFPIAEAEYTFSIDGDDMTLVMEPNRVYTLHKI